MRKLNFLFICALCVITGSTSVFSAGAFAEPKKDNKPAKVSYKFPSPIEVMNSIRDVKLDFKPSITNPNKTDDITTDRKKQAVSLGIYLADYAYLIVFDKQNDAGEYLKTIQNLCSKLRLTFPINKEAPKMFQKKNQVRDSILLYSDEAYEIMMMFCEDNNMQDIFSLLTIGAYMECLYLTLEYIDNYDENNPLISRLADQKHAFTNLSKYVKAFKSRLPVSYLNDFKEIEEIYNALPSADTQEQVKKTNDHIIVEGGVKYMFNEELFNRLKTKVNEARSRYIKN